MAPHLAPRGDPEPGFACLLRCVKQTFCFPARRRPPSPEDPGGHGGRRRRLSPQPSQSAVISVSGLNEAEGTAILCVLLRLLAGPTVHLSGPPAIIRPPPQRVTGPCWPLQDGGGASNLTFRDL